ncbi:Uncharacterised protein [Raoultella terrigena]|uniref:Uncharacterized protein n=1 Tax=Raoultella terrigena TaxID=577 RepID=A0A3P8IWL4_RAOTE|nr:Uncharacterised protein [Raoultella terrigena]
MANISELPSWDSVNLISRSERVEGGQDGAANRPLKQLANRTAYLKEQQENFSEDVSGKVDARSTFSAGATLNSARDEIIYGLLPPGLDRVFPEDCSGGSSPYNTGGVGAGAWAYSSDAAIRQEMASPEGAKSSGYRSSTVYDVLSRMRTFADKGKARPYLGYDPETDSALYDEMARQDDQDIMLNGGIHIARSANGIRRNGVMLSLRGGQPLLGGGFNVPVMGVSDAYDLARYGQIECVPFYADATAPALESWQTVGSADSAGGAVYSADTVTLDATVYAATLAGIRCGNVIRTLHPVKYYGLVKAVDKVSGVVTVDKWATPAATNLTPPSSCGFEVHPITKIYPLNINAFLTANSYANNAVIGEFGASAQKDYTGSVNGLDVVTLAQSTYDLTAGVLVRSAGAQATGNKKGWINAYRAEGAIMNFVSADGVKTTRAGFYETSTAVCGLRFAGKNAFSVLYSKVTDVTDVTPENSPMIVGPLGSNYRQFDRHIVLNANANLSVYYPVVTISKTDITLTMPPASYHLNGHWYKLKFLSKGTYYIASNNGDCLVNGYVNYKLEITSDRKIVEISFDGSNWEIF